MLNPETELLHTKDLSEPVEALRHHSRTGAQVFTQSHHKDPCMRTEAVGTAKGYMRVCTGDTHPHGCQTSRTPPKPWR